MKVSAALKDGSGGGPPNRAARRRVLLILPGVTLTPGCGGRSSVFTIEEAEQMFHPAAAFFSFSLKGLQMRFHTHKSSGVRHLLPHATDENALDVCETLATMASVKCSKTETKAAANKLSEALEAFRNCITADKNTTDAADDTRPLLEAAEAAEAAKDKDKPAAKSTAKAKSA